MVNGVVFQDRFYCIKHRAPPPDPVHPPGYVGHHCEQDQDDCHPSPCADYARCEDLPGGFLCHCPPGLTGRTCHVDIQDCTHDLCQNNATCLDLVNG